MPSGSSRIVKWPRTRRPGAAQGHLLALDGLWLGLHTDLGALVAKEQDLERLEKIRLLEERSGRASLASEQLVAAFRQICGAVRQWGVAEGNPT